MSEEDEKKIMEGRGPYKFNYKSDFLGIPFLDSKFQVFVKAYRPTNTRINYPSTELKFENIEEF